ncbi:methyl-accepting chemotaxis protein [Paracidovorax citrulli]|uniref:methyl-accepting chemotaxis protein n=1 Tax=Paracidovorax citrulli TaxID=80869 RepID=UPI0008866D2F|nr:methyl-accepting chemotaxis protein [Paracidovorax citrulli]UMT87250.1 methyl-accepting chemotaxis protein [Paracidovorax citrulli]WIY33897.1 methyl-accepting chemotaxis protein [Paracidovorax citrulli]SDL38207.1 methyl-accepting chemotaxis sensory transducer with Cache sensor [Paracidovorax citrulli]
MNPAHSITLKFGAASGAALVLTFLLLTTVGVWNVRQQAVDDFAHSSQTRVAQADESLDGTFREVEQNLNYLAQTAQIRSADESLTTYLERGGMMTPDANGPVERSIFALLKEFGDTHPNMRYLDVGTRWGGYVQWPIERINDHYDPRVRPWYQLAMTAPDRVVRPAPYLSAAGSGGAIIPFARAIKGPNGDIIGALEGDLSLEGFAHLTKGIVFGESGYLLVADNNGKILIDPRDKKNEFKDLKSLGGGYEQLAQAADGIATVTMDGMAYRATAYTSPRNGWKYYALIPEAEMMAAANRLAWILVGSGIAVLVLALAGMVALVRRMTDPIRSLTHSMQEIASGDGDMTRRLPVVSRDEVGQLAVQFNAFVEKLHGVLLNVMNNSRQLEVAAHEVSAGNHDLSARTEQQAASIEQTSAAMNELSETVSATADQAAHATQVASGAVEVARRGNDAVSGAARTMHTAAEQSDRIVGIVGLIEGIAFQTNILALNAAVESARAGESGRGFAVVASEVRSLAHRSTEAAREIKALLEASVENVQSGARQIDQAGKTIGELTEAISGVATITSEIAASAREQSRSIAEVNQAVAVLDQATQQNAALVEEISAAAQSLNHQGKDLNATVGFFKLGA